MIFISDVVDRIVNDESPGGVSAPFLALVITDKKVKSAVWGISAGQPQVYAYGPENDWGGVTAEELVVASDASISSAINVMSKVLPLQPTKVVLGVPDSWVDQNGLKPSKTELVKTLTRKLSLSPLGFVVTAETIVEYYKNSSGLTDLILMSVEDSDIEISLVIQGKLQGTVKIGRSDNLALDVEEGLCRFGAQKELPTTFILFGQNNLEQIKQNLIAYPWVSPDNSGRLNFIQLPKFEIAPEKLVCQAVVAAGAEGFGFEKSSTEVSPPQPPDIADIKPEPAEIPDVEPLVNQLEPAGLGFVVGQDIELISPRSEDESLSPVVEMTAGMTETDVSEVGQEMFLAQNETLKAKTNRLGVLGGQVTKQVLSLLGKIKLPRFRFIPPKLFLFALLPLLLAVVYLVTFSFIAQAQIKLQVQEQSSDKTFDFSISAKVDQVDREKLTIPAQETSIDLTGASEASVQGVKKVGDRAAGEVTIFNGTAQDKGFNKGTVMKSSNGLKFTFDEAVTVPAKTTDLNATPPIDKWGEKKVPITAADIGTDYNLPANNSFEIENIASSSAWLVKNSSDISGGTSREVQAVTKEDRDNLSQKVLAELTDKAKSQLTDQLKEKGMPLTDTLKVTDQTDRFDHVVGDEADNIRLEQRATFSVTYIKNEDFYDLTEEMIKSLVPDNYQRKPDAEERIFKVKDENKGTYQAEIKVKYIPLIDLTDLASKLKGKSFSAGRGIIESNGKVTGYEQKITPSLYMPLKRYPFSADKIKIVISST